ncbi:MAG: hypothetical protein HXX14_10880 [Bacteroidetes bacterium]|nr:hypothetical protein [Bacteroidota bacterium]
MKIIGVVFLFLFISLNGISQNQPENISAIKLKCRSLLVSDTVYATEQSIYLTDDIKHRTNGIGFFKSIGNDGSWSDIDYQSKSKSAWYPAMHLYRLMLIYRAYHKNNDPEYLKAIHKGLAFWMKNDFICVNWWHNQINVPYVYASLMVLLDKDASKEELAFLNDVLLKRVKQKNPTGQNKIWQHDIEARIAIVNNDVMMYEQAIINMQSLIEITTKEGIQPDYSFHQHGPMLQFGNYGLHFVNSLLFWWSVNSNTAYAFAAEKQKILFDYCSKGLRWTVFKGNMDITAIGRQLRPNYQSKRGVTLNDDFNLIKSAKGVNACDFGLDGFNPTCPLNGIKDFWRSDYMIYRKAGTYMMSVKMHDPFVYKVESINTENLKGAFLNDGVCLIQRTGKEYKNIEPLWNWTMLPGITCDTTLDPSHCFKSNNISDFTGMVSNTKIGVSAMKYNREGIKAFKSYFFVNDMVVELGAGIESSQTKNVMTTVNQCYSNHKELVVSPDRQWCWHDSIAYLFPEQQDVVISVASKKGDWKSINEEWGSQLTNDSVASIAISHQKNDHYAFIIKPNSSLKLAKVMSKQLPVKILSNTKALQAIQVDNCIMAVFYTPADLKESNETTIRVHQPCLVIITSKGNTRKTWYSVPNERTGSVLLDENKKEVLEYITKK